MNVLRTLFVALVVFLITTRTIVLRLLRGPKHPAWNWRSELWIEGTRAVVVETHRFLSFDFQRRPRVAPRSRVLKERVQHQRVEIGGRYTEIHTPRKIDEAAPTILYFHGGGYVMCSPGTHRELASRLAMFTGTRCIVPSYRLAPEHPSPAALDDCFAVYKALLDGGLAPERLFLAGDSAGGALVLAVLQRARTEGLSLPRAAVLLSPWVDPSAEGDTLNSNIPYDYLLPSMLAMAASMYVGGGHMKDPYICPLEADLHGLPPLLVQSGDAEIFHAQHQAFVERAKAAQVDVTFEAYPGMVHVFQMFGILPASRIALKSIQKFIQAHRTSEPAKQPAAHRDVQASA